MSGGQSFKTPPPIPIPMQIPKLQQLHQPSKVGTAIATRGASKRPSPQTEGSLFMLASLLGNLSDDRQPGFKHLDFSVSFYNCSYYWEFLFLHFAERKIRRLGHAASAYTSRTAKTKAAVIPRRPIVICPDDPLHKRTSVLKQMVCWGYFDNHFRRTDFGTCVATLQQLCGQILPHALMGELKKLFRKAGTGPSPSPRHVIVPPPPVTKLCPGCKVPFVFPATERFYQCGVKKNPIPYHIYKCPRCHAQYSDLERLRPDQDKRFKEITNDVRMRMWMYVPATDDAWKPKPAHWKLQARGKTWTRCNEPNCQALYFFHRGKNGIRTISKHRLKMVKEAAKKEVLPPVSKVCPACKIPFLLPPTERLYQCTPRKIPIHYNIYKCPNCLEEYSNLERLRREQDDSFHDMTNEFRMGIWVCVPTSREEYYGHSHWKLHARGKLWTRCNHPDCQALFQFEPAKTEARTIERHRQDLEVYAKSKEDESAASPLREKGKVRTIQLWSLWQL